MICLINRGAFRGIARSKGEAAGGGQNTAEIRENVAKAIRRGDDVEGLGFLQQFVSGIIDIQHRKLDAGRLAHFHGARAPKSMDRGSAGVFSNDREHVAPPRSKILLQNSITSPERYSPLRRAEREPISPPVSI